MQGSDETSQDGEDLIEADRMGKLAKKSSSDNFQPARALLSKADLEEHFGYNLAEAAAQLGVCKTTIKRACRSNYCLAFMRRDLYHSLNK